MPAMRLYSRDELSKALDKIGFSPSELKSDTGSYWRSAAGKMLLVPEPDPVSDRYSDFIYEDIIKSAILLDLD